MTQYLPPNLLALFAARDPIPYLPPVDKLTWEKKSDGYAGVSHFMLRFEDPKDTPPPVKVETRDERLERKRREKAEQHQYKLEQEIAMWDPHSEKFPTDPYKTLFVARVNYDTSESKLRREFEVYGPIKRIIMVHNKKTSKPRGYAFIEYEHERDMHSAYKHADGKKIDNRRVLVDVERGRTVKGWLPRRLGGGLGGTRRGGPDVNVKNSGRDDDRRRRDDRSFSRERERVPEERVRRRSRSRERERDRKRRSRSRERKRRRSRSREEEVEKRKHRSRSRERKRRSRSRDRKHRRDREREKERPREEGEEMAENVKIKQEPEDDYPDFDPSYYNNYPVKSEDEPVRNGTKQEEGEGQAELDY